MLPLCLSPAPSDNTLFDENCVTSRRVLIESLAVLGIKFKSECFPDWFAVMPAFLKNVCYDWCQLSSSPLTGFAVVSFPSFRSYKILRQVHWSLNMLDQFCTIDTCRKNHSKLFLIGGSAAAIICRKFPATLSNRGLTVDIFTSCFGFDETRFQNCKNTEILAYPYRQDDTQNAYSVLRIKPRGELNCDVRIIRQKTPTNFLPADKMDFYREFLAVHILSTFYKLDSCYQFLVNPKKELTSWFNQILLIL
jgi:hypothetical protein